MKATFEKLSLPLWNRDSFLPQDLVPPIQREEQLRGRRKL